MNRAAMAAFALLTACGASTPSGDSASCVEAASKLEACRKSVLATIADAGPPNTFTGAVDALDNLAWAVRDDPRDGDRCDSLLAHMRAKLASYLCPEVFGVAPAPPVEVPMKRPPPEPAPPQGELTLEIVIRADGTVVLDGAPTSLDLLGQKARAAKEHASNVRANLSADRETRYSDVVRVMDALRQVGVLDFSLPVVR